MFVIVDLPPLPHSAYCDRYSTDPTLRLVVKARAVPNELLATGQVFTARSRAHDRLRQRSRMLYCAYVRVLLAHVCGAMLALTALTAC